MVQNRIRFKLHVRLVLCLPESSHLVESCEDGEKRKSDGSSTWGTSHMPTPRADRQNRLVLSQ